MTRLIFLITLVVLSGCQTSVLKPPVEQGWRPAAEGADHGAYPDNYQDIIKKWYMSNLKDPNSAIFVAFSKPRKEHAIADQFKKVAVFGYSACASVNSKNSYGGYTGAKSYWFLIRNGIIIRTQDPKHHIYIGHEASCEDGTGVKTKVS